MEGVICAKRKKAAGKEYQDERGGGWIQGLEREEWGGEIEVFGGMEEVSVVTHRM